MDNDSGALILLIVLIVSAFLLIVLKLAQFVNHFSREKQYLLTEMHRAADYNEYRYWRREAHERSYPPDSNGQDKSVLRQSVLR